MNNLSEWMNPGLKLKRWFFLLIIGVGLLSYSIAKFIASDELEVFQLLVCMLMFVCGFTAVIVSFFMAQRRILQAIGEANANPNGKNFNMKKLMFDKKMLDRNIKVVAIGGGDGLAALLKGLKIFSNNVTAIVSVIDDDKNNTESLAIQDVKKAMVALANKESDLEDFFTYRILSGELRGRNLGNVFFELMNDMSEGNLSKTIEKTSKIFAMNGKVLPATLDNTTIGAVLTDGTRVIGKRNIEDKVLERDASVEKVFLIPERCAPAPDVLRSIKEADVIIIGPGSLCMNILPSLLIREISDTIRKSQATKIFISNIMTEKNQTNGFAVSDYINMIYEHAGKGLFDHCIYSDSDIMPEYIRRYNRDGSDLIELDKNKLRESKINIIVDDLTKVDDRGIRHDSLKLAQTIFKIVCDNMDLENSDRAIEYYTAKSKLKRMTKKNKKKNIFLKDVKIITRTGKKKR